MPRRIGTHDGTFHADEICAICILRMLPEYADAKILRTRDADILSTFDVVVGVGGVYQHVKRRYDHHQKNFNITMKIVSGEKYPYTTKLSSAGLVWYHYGKRAIEECTGLTDPDAIEALFKKIYECFIREIDGIDIGVDKAKDPDAEFNYVRCTDLYSRVKMLNPGWNPEGLPKHPKRAKPDALQRFFKACDMVRAELEDTIVNYASEWYPARKIVETALDEAEQVHESKKIIVLSRWCPWEEHLVSLEEEKGLGKRTLFVVFLDDGFKTYRVAAVLDHHGKKTKPRMKLAHRRLENDKLSKEYGVEDCIFVGISGLIGGNKTKEGAIKMALESIETGTLHKKVFNAFFDKTSHPDLKGIKREQAYQLFMSSAKQYIDLKKQEKRF